MFPTWTVCCIPVSTNLFKKSFWTSVASAPMSSSARVFRRLLSFDCTSTSKNFRKTRCSIVQTIFESSVPFQVDWAFLALLKHYFHCYLAQLIWLVFLVQTATSVLFSVLMQTALMSFRAIYQLISCWRNSSGTVPLGETCLSVAPAATATT